MKKCLWSFFAVVVLACQVGFAHEKCTQELEKLFSIDHKSRIDQIDQESASLRAESQRIEKRDFLFSPDEENQIRKRSKQTKLTREELVEFRRNDIRLRLFILDKEKWTYWTNLLVTHMDLFSYPLEDARQELLRVQLVTSKPLTRELAWKVLVYRYLRRHLFITSPPSQEMLVSIQSTFSLTDEEMVVALGPASVANYAIEKCLDQIEKSFSAREMTAFQHHTSPEYFPEKSSCCKTGCYNCPWNDPLKKINKSRK